MTVYQLMEDHTKFKTLLLMPDELAVQLGDFEIVKDILRQPSQNSSLKPLWGEVSAEFVDVLTKDSEIPDISIWNSLFLVLSPKAYEGLHSQMSACGEFLPLTVTGEIWYLYTPQTFGKEDKQLTVPKIEYGVPAGVDTLVFDERDICNKLVFKSEMECLVSLFCTDTLKDLVAEHQLTGIGFSEDLTGINFID
ncbi:conserved hypothetical protein [Vibrio nigripulchritudo SOn1]|uniref:Uncharacterized protein n=1 Tax=Vibrio nigripulchritudo SOn1 TaxID=1238450 RepID=A0AAV2VLU9_9VIBR|nr:hypothetical protein [Vibrio nigripulchritudo]CCO45704.1 conserved hypothetical protein [Vibrio nigripulchritudo SOn1]